jgi:hypothetical protein
MHIARCIRFDVSRHPNAQGIRGSAELRLPVVARKHPAKDQILHEVRILRRATSVEVLCTAPGAPHLGPENPINQEFGPANRPPRRKTGVAAATLGRGGSGDASCWRRRAGIQLREAASKPLSNVSKGERAVSMNIQIVRVFSKMRELIQGYRELIERVQKIEKGKTRRAVKSGRLPAPLPSMSKRWRVSFGFSITLCSNAGPNVVAGVFFLDSPTSVLPPRAAPGSTVKDEADQSLDEGVGKGFAFDEGTMHERTGDRREDELDVRVLRQASAISGHGPGSCSCSAWQPS